MSYYDVRMSQKRSGHSRSLARWYRESSHVQQPFLEHVLLEHALLEHALAHVLRSLVGLEGENHARRGRILGRLGVKLSPRRTRRRSAGGCGVVSEWERGGRRGRDNQGGRPAGTGSR